MCAGVCVFVVCAHDVKTWVGLCLFAFVSVCAFVYVFIFGVCVRVFVCS